MLAPGERDVAAGVMARPFGNDEMTTFALPDAAERARRLPGMMGRTVDHARRYGDVRTTGAIPGATGVDGVACWLAPGTTSLTLPRVVRSGLVLLPVSLGPAAARRMSGFDAPMNAAHARLMPGRHWYLWILATDPAHQGKGVGRALLEDGLTRADADGLPVYLETLQESNVRYYTKFGFEIVEEIPLEAGLRAWAMVRQPGGSGPG